MAKLLPKNHRPLIFVAHSLGGLVVEQVSLHHIIKRPR